jgi:RNA polymerase sigma factor (sigma-70 family)
MASVPRSSLVRHFRTLFEVGSVAGLSDGQLIERFLDHPGEAGEVAFEAIVARHGPMVLGVCRRALADPNDAADAFQATFLVLVRKARSIRVDDSLGRWLYGVSRKVAARARLVSARRPRSIAVDIEARATDPDRFELSAILDEELARLPEAYRSALVLCDLEGLTHEEAARDLVCPVGTIKSRLNRGRLKLRERLERRGLAPAPLLMLASPTVPATLVRGVVKASSLSIVAAKSAAGVVPASAIALAEGVLKTMTGIKLKLGLVALCSLGAFASGTVGLAEGQKGEPGQANVEAQKVATHPAAEASKWDRHIVAVMMTRMTLDGLAIEPDELTDRLKTIWEREQKSKPAVEVRVTRGSKLDVKRVQEAIAKAGEFIQGSEEIDRVDIKKALTSPVTLRVQAAPLDLVFESFRINTGANFIILGESLDQIGVSPGQSVSFHGRDIPLKSALKYFLAPLDLSFSVDEANDALIIYARSANGKVAKPTTRRDIVSMLDEPFRFRCGPTPLDRIIEILGIQTGLNIVVDPKALNDKGLSRATRVSLSANEGSLSEALTAMLRPIGFQYRVEDDAILMTAQDPVDQARKDQQVADEIRQQRRAAADPTNAKSPSTVARPKTPPPIEQNPEEKITQIAREVFPADHWVNGKDVTLRYYDVLNGIYLYGRNSNNSPGKKTLVAGPFAVVMVSQDGKILSSYTSNMGYITLSAEFAVHKPGQIGARIESLTLMGDVIGRTATSELHSEGMKLDLAKNPRFEQPAQDIDRQNKPIDLRKKVSRPEYIVEPPDILKVEVANANPPISGPRLVRPDGKINLGSFGDVYVSGLTLGEIQEKLANHLRTLIDDESLEKRITVEVVSFNSKAYYVQGDDVAKPGRLPFTGNETVFNAMTLAGLLTDQLDKLNIKLVRKTPGVADEQVFPVDLDAIVNRGDTETNYQIESGDRLVVYRDPVTTPKPESPTIAELEARVRTLEQKLDEVLKTLEKMPKP